MQIFRRYQFLLAVGLFIFLMFFHVKHVLNSDEGVILDGAWNMINGRELYVDFFHFITPGSFFIIFWLWKIFGVSYLSANILSIIWLFGAAFGLYKINKLLSDSYWAYLTPVFYCLTSLYWPLINHNLYNITLIIWATYFLIRGLENNKINNFLLAGFFSGLSVLFLQSKGIVFFVGITLFLFYLKLIGAVDFKRIIYYFLLSIIIPLIIFIFWPVDVLYQSLIVLPSGNYMDIHPINLFLPSVFIIWLGVLAWFYRNNATLKIKILFFIQILLLVASFYKWDYYHLSIISFPLFILSSLFFDQIRGFKPRVFFAVFFLTVFIILILRSIVYVIYHPPGTIKSFTIVKYIQENCAGPYIYVGPFLPGLYFETGKLNPGPYYSLFTGFNTDRQFKEQAMAIEKYKPTCAILYYNVVSKFNYDLNNPVDQYILQNYTEIKTEFNNIHFYKINNNF